MLLMARPLHLTVIASLAIAQGVIAILVAVLFLEIASIFDQSGTVATSLLVMIAKARGGMLILIAVMYFVFAAGAWYMRGWVWWIGLFASVLSVLYVVHILLRGELIEVAVPGLIIPLIIISYLLSPMGRQAFPPVSG